MSDGQEFCLRWNNFHSNFHLSLDALRGDETFTDVTISCSGKLLRAHRVILSACSSHFKDILRAIPPQQHPVIVLPTVEWEVMQAILEFMYQGQVNVQQAQLGVFLQVAEAFSIQGLADEETKRNADKKATPSRPPPADPGPACSPAAKRRRPEPARAVPSTINIDLNVKSEPTEMLDELDELLEPDGGEHLEPVPGLEPPGVEGHSMVQVGHGDGGTPASAARRGRSRLPPVWHYYNKLSEWSASCRFCQRVIRGAPSSSGNFWVHLRRRHTAELLLLGGEHSALAVRWRDAAARQPGPAAPRPQELAEDLQQHPLPVQR